LKVFLAALFDECRTIWTLGRARDARSFHPLALPGPQIGGSGVLDVTRDQGDKLRQCSHQARWVLSVIHAARNLPL
jgi:hypothetical protein